MSGLAARLHTEPARTPVSASSPTLRPTTHDSGARVVRYFFSAMDFHHHLFTGFGRRTHGLPRRSHDHIQRVVHLGPYRPRPASDYPLQRDEGAQCILGRSAAAGSVPVRTRASFLIYDNDAKSSAASDRLTRSFGTVPMRTTVRSLWQSGLCERWGGSLRRELLDRVVPFGEDHLRKLLRSYIEYHYQDRTHLGLNTDCPHPRTVESRPDESAKVIALPRVGGLHHRYERQKAACTGF